MMFISEGFTQLRTAEAIRGGVVSVVTVSVAAALVADAPGTNAITRKRAPLSAIVTPGEYVLPEAPKIFVYPPAPSSRCHWNASSPAGAPETVAAALNVAL